MGLEKKVIVEGRFSFIFSLIVLLAGWSAALSLSSYALPTDTSSISVVVVMMASSISVVMMVCISWAILAASEKTCATTHEALLRNFSMALEMGSSASMWVFAFEAEESTQATWPLLVALRIRLRSFGLMNVQGQGRVEVDCVDCKILAPGNDLWAIGYYCHNIFWMLVSTLTKFPLYLYVGLSLVKISEAEGKSGSLVSCRAWYCCLLLSHNILWMDRRCSSPYPYRLISFRTSRATLIGLPALCTPPPSFWEPDPRWCRTRAKCRTTRCLLEAVIVSKARHLVPVWRFYDADIFGCDSGCFGYLLYPLGIWRSAFGGVLTPPPPSLFGFRGA